MAEKVIVNEETNLVVVKENINAVKISSPGPQGPRGKTILNGEGAPADNLGLEGDFYYDKNTTRFYGPKLSDLTWVTGPVDGIYSVEISHNLGYNPNVTVKASSGDILETGIDYNSINKITLTMAQPFSGTAYLS